MSRLEVEVSIIVPCFRSRDTIGATLDSLLKQDFPHAVEVIVADSSDDGTADWVRERFPQVTVQHSATRLLPGPARNFGVEHARGRLLAFLDSDACADPSWLATLHRRLTSDPAIVMVGAAIANANPETAVSRVLYWLEFSDFLPGLPAGFRPILSSSNLLVRRETFASVDGFDSAFGMSEDMVFSLAIGSGIFFETATAIRHRHRTEWVKVKAHLHKLGFWSGRFRTQFAVSGSWLRHWPLVSFALLPYRLFQVMRRIRQGDRHPMRAVWDLPRLVCGLWAWTCGFYRGIRCLPEPV
jgi:glycosyltransferase involved in cell wall biosynthesis